MSRKQRKFDRIIFGPRAEESEKAVALNFPNASRSYDETGRCIRFWGYDSAMEIVFQIDEDALVQISRTEQDEISLLHIFDLNRTRIEHAAQRAYSRNRENYQHLSASDFK